MKRTFDIGRDLLKIAAILTMTVDHVGAILYPELLYLRLIGRFAFPIFAYLVVLGVETARNPKRYLLRLFSFALLSQAPYFFAFGFDPSEQLNILFTLLLGALMIMFFDRRSFLIFLPFLASVLFNVEGSIYAIIIIFCMRLLRENTTHGILAIFVVNVPSIFVQDIQSLSLAALPIIALHAENRLRIEIEISRRSRLYSLRKYAFYVYYPIHLAFLYLVKQAIL